jgi:hypothetical protein
MHVWKNIVEQARPQLTIRRMPIVCGINKAADKHSEYVILIVFPPQQWLHQRLSIASSVRFLSCYVCPSSCVVQYNRILSYNNT